MKSGCGTLFWLQPLSGHCRPLSLPLLLSPNGLASLSAALAPAVSCLMSLTHCFCWLHWYAGYTTHRIHIYQSITYVLGAYQPLGRTGYAGYTRSRRRQ